MDRLTKSGIVTTIIGCGICIGAVILYSMERPIEECAIAFGWGLTFLRSKDSLIGIGNGEQSNGPN